MSQQCVEDTLFNCHIIQISLQSETKTHICMPTTLQHSKMMVKEKKQTRNSEYTKRFMTKLQCTVAHGVYDLSHISGASDSVSQAMLKDRLVDTYFPSPKKMILVYFTLNSFWVRSRSTNICLRKVMVASQQFQRSFIG